MHDQRDRHFRRDLLQPVVRDVRRSLVEAVRRADGHSQHIDAGVLDKLSGLLGNREVIPRVLLLTDLAELADLRFDRYTHCVGRVLHSPRHVHVLLVRAGSLPVFLQRAVDHQ